MLPYTNIYSGRGREREEQARGERARDRVCLWEREQDRTRKCVRERACVKVSEVERVGEGERVRESERASEWVCKLLTSLDVDCCCLIVEFDTMQLASMTFRYVLSWGRGIRPQKIWPVDTNYQFKVGHPLCVPLSFPNELINEIISHYPEMLYVWVTKYNVTIAKIFNMDKKAR